MFNSYIVLVTLSCAIALYIRNAMRRYQESKIDTAIADRHGCLPPPLLQNQRPLGVDRLEQIFRANTESKLMELFLFHFRQTGNTLKQVFLLTPAYGTIDPANIEAILSTNFKGAQNLLQFSYTNINMNLRLGNRPA
jgi:hypothetical protein